MKKLLSLLLCFAMLCSICVLPSSAYTAVGSADKETMAVALKELGLFKGVSENDFALSRELTRVEALVMLIRVMGKESDALSDRSDNPFTDTPDWAERYMGYAYKNQLTYGVSDTKYGDGSATAATFLTFILRALGYSDANGEDFAWDDPFTLARKIGILDDTVNLERFTRGDAVTVAYYALFAHIKNSSQTLADRLVSDNAFSKEEFETIIAAVNAASKDSDSIVGLSAYDIAVKNGFKGTEKEWLDSLVGARGSRGAAGSDGKDGEDGLTPYIGENNNWWIGTTDTGISALGVKGDKGDTGATGANGKSAYELAQDNGFIGTLTEWLTSLVGAKGEKGDTGAQGEKGDKGDTGAQGEKGDTGAQGEKGDKGDTGATGANGKSAYELAQDNGFVGTLTEWLASLVGAKGDTGAQGEKGEKGDTGAQGEKGDKGDTGAQGEKGDKGDTGATGADGKSAYELAQDNGFIGTLTEWLASLVGAKGDKGDAGAKGDKGDKGDTGAQGEKGDKGDTGAQGEKGDKGDTGATGANGKSAYELAQDNGFIGTLTEWLASLVGAKGDKGDTGAQGEKGDKGDTGAQGEKGDKGDTGATGANGKSAYELAQDNGFIGSLTEWLASLVGAKGDKGDTGAQGEKGDKGAQGEKGDKGDTGADGRGIERTELVDGELIVHYTDGTSDNLGPITVSAVASSLECLMFTRRSDGTLSVSLKSGYESSVLTEKIIIPSQYNGIDVTYISSFEDARFLKEIIFPNTITEISSKAFYNCSSLESITLSEGLLKIGRDAFYSCTKLNSITLPASVNYISDYAFRKGATEFQEIIFLNPDGWVAGSAGAILSSVMADKEKIAKLLSGGEMYNGNLYYNKILTRENP